MQWEQHLLFGNPFSLRLGLGFKNPGVSTLHVTARFQGNEHWEMWRLRQGDEEKKKKLGDKDVQNSPHCEWKLSLLICMTTKDKISKTEMELNEIWRGLWCTYRRELLEEQTPETARAVLNAALKNDHKHHKTQSLIHVIWHKHSARISAVWLKSSLGKYILGYIKFPRRQYSLFYCILSLTSHNVLCHDDRKKKNTVHRALWGASTKKIQIHFQK